MIEYERLQDAFRKGIRNEKWFDLEPTKKALFRAAKGFLKTGGEIAELDLLKEILQILKSITSSAKRRIYQRGLERVHELRENYEESGVFDWCPRAREWLEDIDHIFYLGARSMNSGGGRSR